MGWELCLPSEYVIGFCSVFFFGVEGVIGEVWVSVLFGLSSTFEGARPRSLGGMMKGNGNGM